MTLRVCIGFKANLLQALSYIFQGSELLNLIYISPGAPGNKQVVIFVDDLNMPRLDRYGSQPPIELLRQYQDFHGFYDRSKLFWKEIQVTLGVKFHLMLKYKCQEENGIL